MRKRLTENARKDFDEFVRTHPKSCLDYKGQPLEYIACGQGTHTLLMLPHISRLFSVEMSYRHILAFERRFRVIAPSLIETTQLDDIADALMSVLDKETSRPVILFGQSGSGITAQVFFRRHYRHVAGMILVNTIAPARFFPKTPLSFFFKLLPAALLKYIITRRLLSRLDTVNLPPDLIPQIQMSRALLCESLKERFSKRELTLDIHNVLQFNAEGFVDPGLLSAWRGRILIVTSQDDAGYEGSKTLSEKLPNTHLLVFDKGYGHLAPLVKSREVNLAIDQLMGTLHQ
ncbi:alpha/beta hydrolase [bacterium]|nr:alpha/beta hydrolase [candidate division CSSED10-310 bacterium]